MDIDAIKKTMQDETDRARLKAELHWAAHGMGAAAARCAIRANRVNLNRIAQLEGEVEALEELNKSQCPLVITII